MAKPCDMVLWVMNWRSAWPIVHGPEILPYILKTTCICCMNIILLDYEAVWPDVWPQNKVGHCDPYFMVQWFCLISWKPFDVWTSYFGIMSQYDPTFDLKINVGHCDLYFMVQWFCLISPRLFGERGGSVVECRTPEREVRGSRPTAAVLCPWASHFTPRKYWLITQEAIPTWLKNCWLGR